MSVQEEQLDIPHMAPRSETGRGPGVASGYRPTRTREEDGGMKRMGMLAGGIVLLLALGIVGWSLLGHRSGPPPVVEADGKPYRAKPENPGGMQIGRGEEILDDADGAAKGKVAPGPEAPAPQALKAQIAAAREEQRQAELKAAEQRAAEQRAMEARLAAQRMPDVVEPQPGAQKPAASMASGSASPLPDTRIEAKKPAGPAVAAKPGQVAPAPAAKSAPVVAQAAPAKPVAQATAQPFLPPATAAGRAATAAVPAAAVPGGGKPTQVQLAALGTEEAAQQEWSRLAKKMPDLLGGRKPTIQRIERDGRTFWRVRMDGFADVAQATGFCDKLRAKGAGCSVASF